MGLTDDLSKEVKEIFQAKWEVRDGEKIPEAENIQLGNHAVKLDGTVLYADLAESTNLVNNFKAYFAAEIYKTYLLCASKIIRDEGGEITAFDGDRVMGLFIGGSKNTTAVRCAMKINYAVLKIINPALKAQYPATDYTLKQAVGIDTSSLYVARTGIRGSNDLVWVGRAANYAAKLCSLRSGSYSSWITDTIYDHMHDSVKVSEAGINMWESQYWTEKSIRVYRSTWHWGTG